ncbi:MAG TPA: RNA methyltransferase [Abditibacterium sp.]
MIISSRQHPFIQLIRSLHSAKGRREHGLFLLEGRNAVGAALETGFALREILAVAEETELSEIAATQLVPVRRATAEIVSYASEAQASPAILALGEIPASHALVFGDRTLVLDGISDPGNVGTLWRAADAAGADDVFHLGGADPFSPKVVRSAAGSLFHLPPFSGEMPPDALISHLREQNVPIIAAQAHGGQNCFDFTWPARGALVLGHETRGISPEVSEAADFAVTIPRFGRAESLNVAMAGTVLLYAWAQSQQKS